jgi:long-subunit acyl-CoA synthetase (AMP-forming)
MTTVASKSATGARSSLGAGTIAEAFQLTSQRCAAGVALRTRDGSQSLTWAEYAIRVRRCAAGLAALGVGRGDAVALMLSNRPEFQILDAAALHLGAIPFSVYNTYPVEQVVHLLKDSGARVIATEQSMLDTAEPAFDEAGMDYLVVVDGVGKGLTLEELEEDGSEDFDFDAAWRSVEADDVLTIIYTSGTTGPPKGVELTHANILGTLRGYAQVIDFPEAGRVISWLPMAHIAERACSHYLPIAWGYETTCVGDPRDVIATLPEVRPTWFFAVPRIWEKLKAALEAGVAAEPDAQKQAATRAAIEAGLERTRAIQRGEDVAPELAARYEQLDELVLSKIRERLGLDKASSINVGAAPTPPEVIEFFHAIGVPLAELWGMSESCASGCVNPPGRVKIGTVGPPLPGFELRLAEDGEVFLRGPGVMAGYRGKPEQTRETIDADGWLATGDIGELDPDGYLKIVDRKKELIINAAGKNMSPANIESALKASSPLIGQAVAIGDRRRYNVALLTLDPDVAAGRSADHPKVQAEVERSVAAANQQLARVEQIKKFKLLPADWQPGGDELTPTHKLKRKPIAEKYADEIDALYRD